MYGAWAYTKNPHITQTPCYARTNIGSACALSPHSGTSTQDHNILTLTQGLDEDDPVHHTVDLQANTTDLPANPSLRQSLGQQVDARMHAHVDCDSDNSSVSSRESDDNGVPNILPFDLGLQSATEASDTTKVDPKQRLRDFILKEGWKDRPDLVLGLAESYASAIAAADALLHHLQNSRPDNKPLTVQQLKTYRGAVVSYLYPESMIMHAICKTMPPSQSMDAWFKRQEYIARHCFHCDADLSTASPFICTGCEAVFCSSRFVVRNTMSPKHPFVRHLWRPTSPVHPRHQTPPRSRHC